MSGAGDVLNEMPIEDCGRLLTLAFAGLQEMCGHGVEMRHRCRPPLGLVSGDSLAFRVLPFEIAFRHLTAPGGGRYRRPTEIVTGIFPGRP